MQVTPSGAATGQPPEKEREKAASTPSFVLREE